MKKYPVPTDIDRVDIAFGNTKYLPPKEEIPEEFWNDNHPACQAAQQLFFKGGKLSDHGFKPKEGIDVGRASMAIGAILASWEPKHEHKIAGVGFLINQWFDRVE